MSKFKDLLNTSIHVNTFFRSLGKSLLHLAFPSKCLHCGFLLPPDSVVLCSGCAALLDLILPEERCLTCFGPLLEQELVCRDCVHNPYTFDAIGAAFCYEGPAASLVKRLKYGNQPYLAKGMAAFLFAQFDRLAWPMPDAIIPVPLSISRWLERGYNQSALLSEEMGKLLQRPVWNCIKRKSGDFSQASLSLEQRTALDGSRFRFQHSYALKGKIVLVVDDVMTSGSTLRCVAEILSKELPASIYALTFCRT